MAVQNTWIMISFHDGRVGPRRQEAHRQLSSEEENWQVSAPMDDIRTRPDMADLLLVRPSGRSEAGLPVSFMSCNPIAIEVPARRVHHRPIFLSQTPNKQKHVITIDIKGSEIEVNN